MSHSGVPIVSQAAGLFADAEGNGTQAPTPIAPPAAPTIADTAAAANAETEAEGRGVSANILGGPNENSTRAFDEELDPNLKMSTLLGS